MKVYLNEKTGWLLRECVSLKPGIQKSKNNENIATSNRFKHSNSRTTESLQQQENRFRLQRARQSVPKITKSDEHRERLDVARDMRQWNDKFMSGFFCNEHIN